MARLIFDNLTKEQVKQLASWYDNQGEQDADVWFEIHEIPTPYVDNSKPRVWDGDDLIMQMQS